jgi:prolyl 4-hydroxylase
LLVWLHKWLIACFCCIAECGRRGIAVKPRKGSALLFWSLSPDGKTKDMTSLHGGCPVLKGDKWSATK